MQNKINFNVVTGWKSLFISWLFLNLQPDLCCGGVKESTIMWLTARLNWAENSRVSSYNINIVYPYLPHYTYKFVIQWNIGQ